MSGGKWSGPSVAVAGALQLWSSASAISISPLFYTLISYFADRSVPRISYATFVESLLTSLTPQEKRYRSMQEHIRRAHPNHYIPKLPATEESFILMVNTPPDQRPQLSPSNPNPPSRRRNGM
jgi:hypothetical protein